ncbi:MAG: hypothetical protein ISS70_24110 [Phycisphaerae bacterium]|nr:hypothetical protein [Phycisphaerae bacterium]
MDQRHDCKTLLTHGNKRLTKMLTPGEQEVFVSLSLSDKESQDAND